MVSNVLRPPTPSLRMMGPSFRQSKQPVLVRPLHRRIEQTGDADPVRQPTIDSSTDEAWREEGRRSPAAGRPLRMALHPKARQLARSGGVQTWRTGHGFWIPASIAGDTWPDVFATTLRSANVRSSCAAPQELGLHENVLLGRRNILMVSTRCAEAPVGFAKQLGRDVD
jgi:hypothetical protein